MSEINLNVDLKTLPEELNDVLSASFKRGDTDLDEFKKNVMKIFKVKSSLSIDEILIGYYQLTKKVLSRQSLSNKLKKLVDNDVLEIESKGIYAVKTAAENVTAINNR